MRDREEDAQQIMQRAVGRAITSDWKIATFPATR